MFAMDRGPDVLDQCNSLYQKTGAKVANTYAASSFLDKYLFRFAINRLACLDAVLQIQPSLV